MEKYLFKHSMSVVGLTLFVILAVGSIPSSEDSTPKTERERLKIKVEQAKKRYNSSIETYNYQIAAAKRCRRKLNYEAVAAAKDLMVKAKYDLAKAEERLKKYKGKSDYQKLSEPRTFYVKVEKANVRKGSGTKHSIITTKIRGDILTAIGKNGSWYHIKLTDMQSGWIHQTLVSSSKTYSSGSKDSN